MLSIMTISLTPVKPLARMRTVNGVELAGTSTCTGLGARIVSCWHWRGAPEPSYSKHTSMRVWSVADQVL